MRVLIVHEYYREWGGEDAAFEADCELLGAAGVDVVPLSFHNSAIEDTGPVLAKVQLFADTVWSLRARRQVDEVILRERPDVVHFHNTFPILSPAVFSAARSRGAAVVATIHNYRLFCANASLFREGAICEDCLQMPVPLPGVIHRCYRGSRTETAAVACMLSFHRLRRTWTKDVDTLIAPSHFLRSKLIESGIRAASVAVRPNAVILPPPEPRSGGDGFLYVGRLAVNKGLETLLQVWREEGDLPPLLIAGTGELVGQVQRAVASARSPVTYLGNLSRPAVLRAMVEARALIFPSLWYENQPMTILEAFACGLPVIASNIGALPELIQDGTTGLLFQPGDVNDLAGRVRWATAQPEEIERMGKDAQMSFEARYSPARSIQALLGLYEDAIAKQAGASSIR
jgi:glycosyltransferase involved in cell wall biosynthesis